MHVRPGHASKTAGTQTMFAARGLEFCDEKSHVRRRQISKIYALLAYVLGGL
jgi:hypothetical protein